jgi:hypothetical protein
MHADELEIDAELVRRLVRSQFPAWASLTIDAVVPRGTDLRRRLAEHGIRVLTPVELVGMLRK